MAPEDKKRFWHKWLWFKIRQAEKHWCEAETAMCALIDEPLEVWDDTSHASSARIIIDKAGVLEDQLRALRDQRLIARAHRWRVFVPARRTGENWETLSTKALVLTREAGHQLREQIFQRKVTILFLIFGVSSVVQTVFAVLSYFWPRR